MLDIPKLGLEMLHRVQTRIAEQAESADEFDAADACIEALKGLVNPKTEIKQALMAKAETGTDYVRLEREVMYSLMQSVSVKEMM